MVKWPAVEKANYTGRKENSYTAVASTFSEASLKAQAQASWSLRGPSHVLDAPFSGVTVGYTLMCLGLNVPGEESFS